MEHQTVIAPSAATRLTESGKTHVALPFHHTPLGYPRVPGKLWNPIIGSGPFVAGLVPTDMPLSDGAKFIMSALAQKGNFGFTVADLKIYMGFNKHGKLEPAPTG